MNDMSRRHFLKSNAAATAAEKSDKLSRKMTSGQIARAEGLARDWKSREQRPIAPRRAASTR